MAPGFARSETVVDRAPGLPTTRLKIRVPAAAHVEGKVTLDDGTPLKGVKVAALVGMRKWHAVSTHAFRTKTDASGCYRLDGLAPRFYQLFTRRPGDAWLPGPVISLPGAKHFDFRLTEGVVFRGLVTDHKTGAPVIGARVRLLQDPGFDARLLGEALTGRDGRYRIRSGISKASPTPRGGSGSTR